MAALGNSPGDYSSFVQARWPVLVRSLVAEGVEVAEAETVVAAVLARLRPGWSRLARDEDADVRVWAEVRAGAGLPPHHGAVAPILDDPILIERTADVTVSHQPLGLIDVQARQRRRGVLRSVVIAAVAVVVVGGYLAWATTRTPAPDVDDEANPAPVPWYAEGRLHLDQVSVELPGLGMFVVTGDDEVTYLDKSEQWHEVNGDGDVTAVSPPDASALIDGNGGVHASPDERYLVTVTGGGALLYDTQRGEPLDTGLGAGVRVLDATFADDGSVTYVVTNLLERPDDTAVRLSETGTLGLRTCTFEPVECREVVRVSGSSGNLRLR